ncbi:ER membrane protein complex subunit 10-like [Salvia splendens]|uniref:ER membrane protein complex subunit 10-like n=1 Tax=Salvia splendens TaxID=180675 RepID=UPI001C26318F|nr:ER membrane protein complex subunit 10-like [Salvia splendens]XP_042068291.1 ER membrane protein complex subunit 10-like [Salvia splendens]
MATTTIAQILSCFFLLNIVLQLATTSFAFQSDELLVDDDEFGLEGGRLPDPPPETRPATSTRRRSAESGSDLDSKIQFQLEHAFGDSDFSPAGTFTARLKKWPNGGQTLTKLRFSRNALSQTDKENFKRLIEGDDFYQIRLPSNLLNQLGREHVISSVKARCLSQRDALDEHFVINMDGVNVLGVNYGPPGSCQYPRVSRPPTKWSFNSHTLLKYSNEVLRTPVFTEAVLGENGEGEELKPPERSFWAKYWMYLIPLGLIVMNAMTQAMNLPEEQGTGQPGSQGPQAISGRGQAPAVRRRN